MNGHNYTKVANWSKFRDDFFFDLNAEDSNEWIIIGFVNNGWQIENKNGKRFILDTKKWNENAATYELPEELKIVPPVSGMQIFDFSTVKKPIEKLAVITDVEYVQNNLFKSLGVEKTDSGVIEVTPTDDISEEDLLNVIQEQENLPAAPVAKKKGRPAAGSKK